MGMSRTEVTIGRSLVLFMIAVMAFDLLVWDLPIGRMAGSYAETMIGFCVAFSVVVCFISFIVGLITPKEKERLEFWALAASTVGCGAAALLSLDCNFDGSFRTFYRELFDWIATRIDLMTTYGGKISMCSNRSCGNADTETIDNAFSIRSDRVRAAKDSCTSLATALWVFVLVPINGGNTLAAMELQEGSATTEASIDDDQVHGTIVTAILRSGTQSQDLSRFGASIRRILSVDESSNRTTSNSLNDKSGSELHELWDEARIYWNDNWQSVSLIVVTTLLALTAAISVAYLRFIGRLRGVLDGDNDRRRDEVTGVDGTIQQYNRIH